MLGNTSTHYGTVARLLHWGTAALIGVSLACVELHELFPKGSETRLALMLAHFQIGLLVFILLWPRIAQHIFERPPAIRPEPPRWQSRAAKLIHVALYVAMIALPVTGVLMQQANDRAVALLGMPLPVFVGVDKGFSKSLHEIHETIGNLMILLIFAHIGAAIWHHKILRDNTLFRMLPPPARPATGR